MTNPMQSALPDHFANLFDQMQRALVGPPGDLPRALRELPPVDSLPSPWESWTLITLIEYRERQDEGRQLLRQHLPQAVPPCADYRRRDQPVQDYLPDLPQWEYSIECSKPQFATLKDRQTGELIFIDVGREATQPFFTDWIFEFIPTTQRWRAANRLRKLTSCGARRSKTFDPDVILHLRRERFVRGMRYHDPRDFDPGMWPDAYRLTDLAMCYADLMLGFCRSWAKPQNRLWASALIGDWLLAHELAVETGNTELIRITGVRREQCRLRRLSLICEEVGNSVASPLPLKDLAEIGAPDLDD